ncbi:MAG: imelysin family protein [Celeribacter sp.]|jgi:predicted lipoprotein
MRLFCRLACSALTGAVLLGPSFGTPVLAQTASTDLGQSRPPVASIAPTQGSDTPDARSGTAAAGDPVVDHVIDAVIMPNLDAFAASTAALAQTAQTECLARSEPLRAAWAQAFDDWLMIEDYRLGPLEDEGRRYAIAYWPDAQGHRPRALARLIATAPAKITARSMTTAPVSVRGLYAIEALLFDPRFSNYTENSGACAAIRAISADLADLADIVRDGWAGKFGNTMRTPGTAGNSRFLDASEPRQALYTALLSSLGFDIDERLGGPLGTFDTPRPKQAESRLSERSLDNLLGALDGHEALALGLSPDAPTRETLSTAFANARAEIAALDDPILAGVADPMGRFRVEALQSSLLQLRREIEATLGPALGVSMGLNSMDGD